MRSARQAGFFPRCKVFVIVLVLSASQASAQEGALRAATAPAGALIDALGELQDQVREINTLLVSMRAEEARSHEEILRLRRELQEAKSQLGSMERDLRELHGQPSWVGGPGANQNSGATSGAPKDPVAERLARVEEDQQLLGAKIDEQFQTKVESASRYRMRLSGIVLLNVFGNRGKVDNQDLPSFVLPQGPLDSSGDFGATMRQTELGLEVFGPKVAGAKTSADAQFDFFGGFPNTTNGVTAGLVRLRTAEVRFDWPHTSIVAGQEAPFFSPLSPTSLASLALPAFAYSGNLWTWTPEIWVEHRVDLSDVSGVLFQVGILDPLAGEPPDDSFNRSPQAGEKTRQPASAARVAWTHRAFGRPMTLGAGGYFSHQNSGFSRATDGWAGTADWSVPLGRWVALTGEFYRGRAIGGLGGSLGRSTLWNGPLTDPATSVLGLNSTGGWADLKFKPTEKLEFNGAYGQDSPRVSDFRRFPQNQSYFYPSIGRNQSALLNFIYRPRANLLVSLEYRRLQTFMINGGKDSANHINLSLGMLF